MDWSQLLDASANQEQQGGIDQQLADILARRKAYQPSQHTTGLGSAFGGLADILMRNRFDSQEQALRAQKLDLARQMAAGRGAYAQALNSASAPMQAPPEMIAAPGVNQASVDRDQQQKLQQLRTGGMLSGDPLIAQYLERAPKMAQEQQQLEQGAQRFPLQQAMERQQMQQQGPQAALGGLPPSVYETLTKRLALTRPEMEVNPVTGGYYNRRGALPPDAAAGGAGAGAGYDKRLPKMQESFAKDFDPNIARGGLPKENQARINAGDRILAIAVGKDPLTGQEVINDLPPAQMTDLATAAAALLSNGGGDAGTRHEMTPFTKGRTWAQTVQWLTDEPKGAGQQGFVKLLVDMARREQGVAQTQIRSAQQQRLANHLGYYSTFPEQAKAQLQSYGWDPSEVDLKTGAYTPKAKAAPPPAAPVRKTLGDKTYEKRADGWYEVTGG